MLVGTIFFFFSVYFIDYDPVIKIPQEASKEQKQVLPIDRKHYNELSKEEHLQLYAEYLDIEEKVEEKLEVSQNDILKSS